MKLLKILLVLLLLSPYALGGTCSPDVPGCFDCKDADSTKCQQCLPGYSLNFAVGTCSFCPPGSGNEDSPARTADTTCGTQCDDPNCTCPGSDPTICFGCAAGYRAYTNEAAFPPRRGCTPCSGGFGIAAETSPTYSAQTTCNIQCAANCNSCGSDPTVCLTCAAGYYSYMLNGNKLCIPCSGGYGIAAEDDPSSSRQNTICTIRCESQCGSCTTSKSTCRTCAAGYYLSAAGTCTSCPVGFGKPADATFPTVSTSAGVNECWAECHSTCSMCKGTGAADCLNCAAAFKFDGDSRCEACTDRSTKLRDTVIFTYPGICDQNCHISCESCITTTANSCKKCAAGHYWAGNSRCTVCPAGVTKAADSAENTGAAVSNSVCSDQCSPACKHCAGTAATNCLSCKAGYYLIEGECRICDDGKGKAIDSSAIMTSGTSDSYCTANCHSSCNVCSVGDSATSCLSCGAGYYMGTMGQCSLCLPGKTKAKDTSFPTASVQNTACTLDCHGSCSRCTLTTSSGCLACAAGHFWTGSNTCAECPDHKGRVADASLVTGPALIGVDVCTLNCHSSCKICKGESATDCVKCAAGYYLSAAGTCTMCPSGRGKLADSGIPSVSTNDGYDLCSITCAPGCNVCTGTNPNQCLSCGEGYFYSDLGTCTACPAGKSKLIDTSFPLLPTTSDLACSITCHSSCYSCNGEGGETDCLRCAAGFYKSAPGTCTMCPSGRGKDEDETSVAPGNDSQCRFECYPECRLCSTASRCLACSAGYFYSGTNACTQCSSGTGKAADISVQTTVTTDADACTTTCHGSCILCKGNTADDCLFCRAGFYKSAATTCTNCPPGKGKYEDAYMPSIQTSDACVANCHPSCLTCSSDNPTACINCNSGFWWAGEGRCTQCANSHTKNVDVGYRSSATTEADACTTACDDGCKACAYAASPNCIWCQAAFYLSAPGVCTSCGSGRGTPAGSAPATVELAETMCLTCHPTCESCINGAENFCIKCRSGYYLSAVGVCTMCPPRTGKQVDGNIPAISTSSGQTECQLDCHPSCRACFGPGPSHCIACAGGYWWAGSGVCTQCPDTRGIRPDTALAVVVLTSDDCGIRCYPSCLICAAGDENECVKCRDGYFLSDAGVCSQCPPGLGKEFDIDTPEIGTGIDKCTIRCDPTCGSCNGPQPTSCLSCAAGYYFSAPGTCTICNPGFGKPVDPMYPTAPTTADSCTQTCHFSCSKCKGPLATDCLNCKAGFYLSAANTCSFCPDGYGKAQDPEFPYPQIQSVALDSCTRRCHPSCRTCSGPGENECVTCAASHFWAGSGTCSLCNEGYGKPKDTAPSTQVFTSTDVCVQCYPDCSKCKGPEPSDCLSCNAGLYFDLGCYMCPQGRGKAKDTGINYPASSNSDGFIECGFRCDPKCGTCKGEAPTDCLTCAPGYFWAGAGVCTICTPGTGKSYDNMIQHAPTGDASQCQADCHPTCSKCKGNGNDDCLNCKPGFFLSGDGTCSMCPTGLGKHEDPEFPLPEIDPFGQVLCAITCHPSCGTCTGPTETDCLNCNEGFWWAGSGRCTACDPTKGKPADDMIPDGPATAAACNVDCHPSCKVCKGTESTDCLSCAASFFKTSPNECDLCPTGYGKPQDQLTLTEQVSPANVCTSECDVSCSTCSGSTASDCIRCQAGYYRSSPTQCSLCPAGFGKQSDQSLTTVSGTDGQAECGYRCHPTCLTCSSSDADDSCMACPPGRFLERGYCVVCASGTGKLADTGSFKVPQTPLTCTATCHPSCQMCSGPNETDCLNCNAGYWWAGNGRCSECPFGRGKAADTDLFPTSAVTSDICTIYCDSCSGGCKTCGGEPTACATCVSGRFMDNKQCLECPENCKTCTSAEKCTVCEQDFLLNPDSTACTKCAVDNCQICETDVAICTKCKDQYTLKSSSECVLQTTATTTPAPMVDITPTNTPGLELDILEDKLTFDLGVSESKTVSKIFVVDKISNRKYTCEELRCNHFSSSKGISVTFDSEITVKKGVLTIERVDPTVTKSLVSNSRKRVLLQAYPLVIDNFVLMGKSNLKTFSYATKIIVSILRLPLSLLVFWKYPRFSMLMDFMITHLKTYSLIGGPYMAFVEVVYQVVSDSKILPFNFSNPFELWNPDTIACNSKPALKSKNVQCSFFDNYGQNIIGLASLAVLLLAIHYVGKYVSTRQGLSTKQSKVAQVLANGYGYQFFIAKLDANHLEIILFTIISYSTADPSSKSVIGIIFNTVGLIGFFLLTIWLTKVGWDVWLFKSAGGIKKEIAVPSHHMVVQDTEHDMLGRQQRSVAAPEVSDAQITDKVSIPQNVLYAFVDSALPKSKLSALLHAGRYFRAVLLAIFVGVVSNPVEQIVLVIILESLYLAFLLVLDYRGSVYERGIQLIFQGLMVLHLIFRAISTSPTLTEDQVHSVLSTMIAVVLITYIVLHMILALLTFAGLFFNLNRMKTSTTPKSVEPQPNKLEMNDTPQLPVRSQAESRISHMPMDLPEEKGVTNLFPGDGRAPEFSMHNPQSFVDLEIPAENMQENSLKPQPAQMGLVDARPTASADQGPQLHQ